MVGYNRFHRSKRGPRRTFRLHHPSTGPTPPCPRRPMGHARVTMQCCRRHPAFALYRQLPPQHGCSPLHQETTKNKVNGVRPLCHPINATLVFFFFFSYHLHAARALLATLSGPPQSPHATARHGIISLFPESHRTQSTAPLRHVTLPLAISTVITDTSPRRPPRQLFRQDITDRSHITALITPFTSRPWGNPSGTSLFDRT